MFFWFCRGVVTTFVLMEVAGVRGGYSRSLVSRVRPQRQTVQPITADTVRIASRMAHQ